MVQSTQKHKVRIAYIADPENVYVDLGIDPNLKPGEMMTSLLFARDYLKEMIGHQDVTLMFDEEMPTSAEEILEQRLERVLMKPKAGANQGEVKADVDKTAEMYVNQKGQLIKSVTVNKNGRDV